MYYFYEGRTIRGVGLVGWALVVLLVAVLVLGATTAIMGVLYGAILQNTVTLIGPLLGVLAAICMAFVAEVAAGVLFLLAFYQIHAGRHEYGLEQTRSVERALIFLIIYIVLSAVSLGFSSTGTLLLGITSPSTLPMLAGALVLNPIAAFFAGLSLEHSVRTLANPAVRSRLRTALILGILGAAVGPGLTLLATAGGIVTVDMVSTGIVAAALGGQGISALSLLLFWLGYQDVHRSLLAGSPAPVLPRLEQLYPWLYRPWAPYPYSPPAVQPPQLPKT